MPSRHDASSTPDSLEIHARVPAQDIEALVEAKRHPTDHLLRLRSDRQRWYLLHSEACVAEHPDLRDCPVSLAALYQVDESWPEDVTMAVALREDEPGVGTIYRVSM